jgi:hypothetical protein
MSFSKMQETKQFNPESRVINKDTLIEVPPSTIVITRSAKVGREWPPLQHQFMAFQGSIMYF